MTVKELIEKLQTLDPNLRVFVSGYEGGYDDAAIPNNIMDIALDYHDEWYYGKHEDANVVDKTKYIIVEGVIL